MENKIYYVNFNLGEGRMFNFLGNAKHTFDDQKNRLTVPAKFREGLGEEFVIMPGYRKCLMIYTMDEFSRFAEKFDDVTLASDGVLTDFFADSERIKPDKQGRFTIEEELKKYAGLAKEVIFIGVLKRIEVWDAREYENYREERRKNPGKIAEELKSYGI
jgi:MraZ protein